MARESTRLILSFIGNTDLRYQEPTGEDKSPILRLLLTIREPGSDLQKHCNIPPDRTRLVLLDDDRQGRDERAWFCDWLSEQLKSPGLGLRGLTLERHPVALPEGPTDLTALFEQVWKAIPTSGPDSCDEVVFHVTSGTPAMQLTLVLASQSLRLEKARLFETSPKPPHVRELTPPYALALRKSREHERVAYQSPGSLDAARKGLLKGTVVDDTLAESAYAALHKAACNRKRPQRVLISGPTGSGKWHACRQFARWRKCQDPAIWTDPAHCPELPEGTTLLIHRLDTWPESAWRTLAQLADERRDLAMAATFRIDRRPDDALVGLLPVQIRLPALGARTDVVALAESLACELGLLDGKLKERLQHDLFTNLYPRSLHELKALLATASAYSPGAHPERKAYLKARDLQEARRLLDEAWQVLTCMDFGVGRHRLDDVLKAIRAAVVRCALTDGRSQEETGAPLGLSQSTISEILDTELDPQLWQSLGESDHGTP